jgi:hypothetical protein
VKEGGRKDRFKGNVCEDIHRGQSDVNSHLVDRAKEARCLWRLEEARKQTLLLYSEGASYANTLTLSP